MRLAALSLLAVAVVSACSEPAADDGAQETATAPESKSAPPVALPSAPGTPLPETTIPEPLRGEWGINLADCDVSSGAAKGNLQIDANSLKFYESVARIDRINSLSKVGIGAEFQFSGEGQEWKRTMQLSVSPDGKTLTSEEIGPDAMEGPLTYQRCPE
jgi:hypothetical protein